LRSSKGLNPRTAWHGGIKYVYAFLVKLAGASRVLEPEKMMLFSNDRPDLALHEKLCFFTAVADFRTVVPSNDGECLGAAATLGHAAAVGAAAKESKWVPQATAQGLSFFALYQRRRRPPWSRSSTLRWPPGVPRRHLRWRAQGRFRCNYKGTSIAVFLRSTPNFVLVISPTHKRTEGSAPVWGSEFTSKDADYRGASSRNRC
jgi:hypothetical protein